MRHAVQTIYSRRGTESKRPFFVAVGFHKPHLPFTAPKRYYNWYNPEDIKLPLNPFAPVDMPRQVWSESGELRMYGDVKATNATGNINTTFPDFKTKQLRRGYYAAVSYTDYNVGGVLYALRDAGLENDTIVVFLGDHGWSLGEHGRWDKHTTFDTDTHCPLMIKVPGLTNSGSKSQQLTSLVDLFPTLVELVFGEEVLKTELPYCPEDSSNEETCREGRSLVPLLQDPLNKIHDAVYSVYGRGVIPPKDRRSTSISTCYFSCKM